MFRIDRSLVKISDIKEIQANTQDVTAEVDSLSVQLELESIVSEQTVKIEAMYAQAQSETEDIIAEAHREADAIRLRSEELLHQAEADSEQIMTEAKQLGYELGYNEGRAEGEASYNSLIEENRIALDRMISELDSARTQMLGNMEGDIIDLCFSVVRSIAALDRTSDGEIFRAVIKKALSQIDVSGRVTLRLSGEDYMRFFPGGDAIFDMGDSRVTVTVSEDEELSPGDIELDSDDETVVAGVETQLRNLTLTFSHLLGKDNED